jgi:hypothetical protein
MAAAQATLAADAREKVPRPALVTIMSPAAVPRAKVTAGLAG